MAGGVSPTAVILPDDIDDFGSSGSRFGGLSDSIEVRKSRLGGASGSGGVGLRGSLSDVSVMPMDVLSKVQDSDSSMVRDSALAASSAGLDADHSCLAVSGDLMPGLVEEAGGLLKGVSSVLSDKITDSMIEESAGVSSFSSGVHELAGQRAQDGGQRTSVRPSLAGQCPSVDGQRAALTGGNLPMEALLIGRTAPDLRKAGQGDFHANGKGKAGISRSYASVTISDMRGGSRTQAVVGAQADLGVSDSGVGVLSVAHELAPELPCGGLRPTLSSVVPSDVPACAVSPHLSLEVSAARDSEWIKVGSRRRLSGRTEETGDRGCEGRLVSPCVALGADEGVLRQSVDHEHGRDDCRSLPSSPGHEETQDLVGGLRRSASVAPVGSPKPRRSRRGKGRRQQGT
ncbi:hypothetical protein Dimus_036712 [Dionaea muscipula]